MPIAPSFSSVDQYITALPVEKQRVISQLRQTILDNLPARFSECIN